MSGYTALPTKSPGDLLTSALWNTYLQGNADSGFCRKLADSIVAGSSVANITFASIPQTFAHLMLIVYARDTSGNNSDNLLAQFNGDTAANYDAADGISNAQTTMIIGKIAGGTASTNRMFGSLILIPHYADTSNHKIAVVPCAGGWYTGADAIIALTGVGNWRSTAAINQILLKSSAGNIAIGSRVTLYGLPA